MGVIGMLGLGYYIVPMVSNTALASIKKGWYALYLINASVIFGYSVSDGGHQ
jgi:cytochrome c oxidase cbb3-type subunit 1